MTRIKVKDLETNSLLEMDVEPDGTVRDILKSAAAYWGKAAKEHVIRKDGTELVLSTTVVQARINDGDSLEFLSEEAARKAVLMLVSSSGRSLRVEEDTVLGRDALESFLGTPKEAELISGRHLRVTHHAGIFAVEDGPGGKPSRNGTTLNGQDLRGRGPVPVREGDKLGIANVLHLTVRIVRGG